MLQTMWTIIKGLVLGALSMVAFGALALFIAAAIDGEPLVGALLGAYIAGFVAPVAMLVFGLPAHIALRWAGLSSLRAYLWAGFGLAAALCLAMSLSLPHSAARFIVALIEMAFVIVCGPMAAAVFWYAVRPDRAAS